MKVMGYRIFEVVYNSIPKEQIRDITDNTLNLSRIFDYESDEIYYSTDINEVKDYFLRNHSETIVRDDSDDCVEVIAYAFEYIEEDETDTIDNCGVIDFSKIQNGTTVYNMTYVDGTWKENTK